MPEMATVKMGSVALIMCMKLTASLLKAAMVATCATEWKTATGIKALQKPRGNVGAGRSPLLHKADMMRLTEASCHTAKSHGMGSQLSEALLTIL
jgi:hypothetical protein